MRKLSVHLIWAAMTSLSVLPGPALSASESVLYSFKGGTDGAFPIAGLIEIDGELYGTTTEGGAQSGSGKAGYGTLFKISTTGDEVVLHNFGRGADGATPAASLVAVGHELYGTTFIGGINQAGVVYRASTSGAEKVVYSFVAKMGNPYASLINVRGTLYGTVSGGNPYGLGAVYKISKSGTFTPLYSFAGGTDGAAPYGGVIDIAGDLYGTTLLDGSQGYGTSFRISAEGEETVLANFNFYNGGVPYGNLIRVGGVLYGTTSSGGAVGSGTIFSLTTAGDEKVVYSFTGGNNGSGDGDGPFAGLINVAGIFYGTTRLGGGTGCDSGFGCGTVFSVTPKGKEVVLYAFQDGADGSCPIAPLISFGGAFYGTTKLGGAYGKGTVFKVVP